MAMSGVFVNLAMSTVHPQWNTLVRKLWKSTPLFFLLRHGGKAEGINRFTCRKSKQSKARWIQMEPELKLKLKVSHFYDWNCERKSCVWPKRTGLPVPIV